MKEFKYEDSSLEDSFSSKIRVHHGFYETNEELDIPEITEEELYEYKKLIGMPLTDDYDELMESLITSKHQLILRKDEKSN